MKRMVMWLWLLMVVCTMLSIAAAPAGAAYPERPIVILCWSEPGSTVDIMSRGIAEIGKKYVGQPMSVETKTGGGGVVALAHLLKQKPDGYTLQAYTRSFSTMVAWDKLGKMKLDDFAFICLLIKEPLLLAVNAEREYDTWQKFVEYAKKNPSKLKVTNPGSGQLHHTSWLRFARAAGIKTLDIPYDGGRPAVTSVMGGHDDAVFNNPSILKTPIETGKLKGLFVSGDKRLDYLPDIPTLKELGIDMEEYHYRGLMASAGVPKEHIAYLAQAFKKMTDDPEWKALLKKMYWESAWMGLEDFTKFSREDSKEIRETLMEEGLIKK